MIKDKNIRDRFSILGLDDDFLKEKEYKKQLDDINFLLIKAKIRLKSIDNSLEEARESRRQLIIPNNFSIIESLDKRINELSNKKNLLSNKINELEEYIKREREKRS